MMTLLSAKTVASLLFSSQCAVKGFCGETLTRRVLCLAVIVGVGSIIFVSDAP